MANKKINPLTTQSKKWLLEALLYLMGKKKYSEITIKELTKQAGLDRKTFYRHFKTKDEILNMPIQEAYNVYVDKLKNLSELNAHNIAKAYFSMCLQYIEYFNLLSAQGLLMVVLMKFEKFLPTINEMLANNPEYRKRINYELAFYAGGFWNITLHWIDNGAKETPEEMAKIIGSIMPVSLRH